MLTQFQYLQSTAEPQEARCSLPSADSACRLVGGDLSALPVVAFHTVGRAALIGLGIAAVGERNPKTLAKYSLGGALMIEAFVLAWTAAHRTTP